jgi:hypothetical protein
MDTPRVDMLKVWLDHHHDSDYPTHAGEFQKLARQLERELNEAYERAAKVCEDYMNTREFDPYDGGSSVENVAALIRALKPK